MNDKQQKMVLDAMWVVNTVLQKYGKSTDEDLRQEGLLELCKASLTFVENGGAKFETYAYRCVCNRIVNLLRSENRRNSHIYHYGDLFEYADFFDDNGLADDGGVEQSELKIIYDENIGKLTALEKKVVIAKSENKSMQEIAETYNITRNKARTVFRLARQKIKGTKK